MTDNVPLKNKSTFGWWVATLIERFQFDDEDLENPRRRCRAFSNTVILKAKDRDEAYSKAMKYGQIGVEETHGCMRS